MRIGLIQVMQETCSFNPTPTTLADFESFGILEGAEMLEHSDSVGPVGGYLEAVARSGSAIETVPIVRGTAQSGGRLTREAFEFFDAKVRNGLAGAGALDGSSCCCTAPPPPTASTTSRARCSIPSARSSGRRCRSR